MKLYNEIISEIRKSEKVSGKADKLSELGHPGAVKYIKTNKLDTKTHGVTMTKIPKVGINPSSQYDTPVGIYFYPMDYYVELIEKDLRLPWQHNAKYINILEFINPDKIWVVSDNSISERTLLSKIKSIDLLDNEPLSILIDDLHEKSYDEARFPNTPGGRIWYVLWSLSDHLSINSKEYFNTESRPAVIWNWLLRKMGFDVILDYGESIIHYNEPTQGFAVSNQVIKWIKTIDNEDFRNLKQRKNKQQIFNAIYSDGDINNKEIINLLASNEVRLDVPPDENVDKKLINIINKKATPETKKELISRVPRLYYELQLDEKHLWNLRDSILHKFSQATALYSKTAGFFNYLYKINNLREFFNIYFLIKTNDKCNKMDYVLEILFGNENIQNSLDTASEEFKAAYWFVMTSHCSFESFTTKVDYIPDTFGLNWILDNNIENFRNINFQKLQQTNKDYIKLVKKFLLKTKGSYYYDTDRDLVIPIIFALPPFSKDKESFLKEFSSVLRDEDIEYINSK